MQVLNRPNFHSRRIYLKGLDAKACYRVEGMDGVYRGDTLMKAGIQIENPKKDFGGQLVYVTMADE